MLRKASPREPHTAVCASLRKEACLRSLETSAAFENKWLNVFKLLPKGLRPNFPGSPGPAKPVWTEAWGIKGQVEWGP